MVRVKEVMRLFHRYSRLLAAALLVVTSIACAPEPAAAAASAAAGAVEQPRDIKHVEPSPDSVGPQPVRFSWTKVDAAESYTLRIWNEADVRVVSETGLTVTSIDFPKDMDMPAGTYFWSIVAMRGEDAVAESGLAAFVVQKP
jgi:hypothetical protein